MNWRLLLMRFERVFIACSLSLCLMPFTVLAAKKTIEVWDPVSPSNMHGKGIVAVYDAWNKLHPDMPIKRVAIGDPRQKLMAAMAAGTAPDLVYFDRFQIPSYAAKDIFTPLDSLIKTSKVLKADMFFPAAWGETQYQGKHWAIPHQVDDRALIILDKVAQSSGLNPDTPPKTIDELELWAKKMTIKDASGAVKRVGFAPTRGNWFYYGWLWNFGGQLLNADKTKPAFNSSEGKTALNWIVDYTNRVLGGFPSLAKAESKFVGSAYDKKGPFQQEQLGMEIEGDWMLWQMKTYAPNVEYTFAPIPAPAGRKSITWVGGWSWVIPKGAKHLKEAWKFLEFQGSEEGMVLFARISGRIPAVKSAAYDEEFLKYDAKRQRQMVDAVNTGIFRPTTPVGDKLWDSLNYTMIESVKSGKRSPEQALAIAEQEISKEIARYKVRIK